MTTEVTRNHLYELGNAAGVVAQLNACTQAWANGNRLSFKLEYEAA